MNVLGGVEANPLEIRSQLVFAIVVPEVNSMICKQFKTQHDLTCSSPLFAPFDSGVVHFVDQDHQVLHPSSLHQHGVLSCLAATLESRLELTLK